jgi:hypothetical protein
MLDHPVNTLHHCLAHAAYVGFPDYEYEQIDLDATRDWTMNQRKEAHKLGTTPMAKKTRKHDEYIMEVYAMFPQVWSSTALGFGGLGGQAITSAYTVVIESQVGMGCCVYFGGRFAYRIAKPNETFYTDIAKRQMHKVSGAKERYEQNQENTHE